jgi:hypothetical protein
MCRKQVLSKALFALLVAGLLLPVTICIVMALAALLEAMKDSTGGAVLRYVALTGGVVWVVDLVAIVLVQAIGTLQQEDERDRVDERDRQDEEDRR